MEWMKPKKDKSMYDWQYHWKKKILEKKNEDSNDTETGSNNTNKTGPSKITKENSTDETEVNAKGKINNWMNAKETKRLWARNRKRKHIIEMSNG